MLQTTKKHDGTYEVMSSSWCPDEQDLRELETIIQVAAPMGVVVRVCRNPDRNGKPRPVKAILSVDPLTIKTS